AFVLQVVLLFLVSGIVTSSVIYFSRDFIAVHMNNPALASYLQYYCVYILFFIATEYFIHLLISKDLYSLGVKIESAEVIFRVTLLILPLVFGFGLTGLAISLAIYAVCRFCFYSVILRRDIFPIMPGVTKLFTISEQLAYSLPLALSFLLGLIGRTIDKFLISVNFTPAQMAVYSVGAVELPLDSIFQASVANVLRASFPELVKKGDLTEMIRIWRAAVRKLALIILPVFVFLLGYSTVFITFLFTDAYIDSVDIFRIYLFLVPLHILLLSILPQAFGKTKLTMKIVMICATFNIFCSFVLVKTIGYYGPAIATVATSYLTAGLYLYFGLKLLKCNVRTLVPLRSILRVVTSASLGVIVGLLFISGIESKFLKLLLGGIIFLSVYCSALLVTSEISRSEVKSFWHQVKKKLPEVVKA
ncbi:MAG: oligosaccharide flippase family protein, partial [Gammaproteobacteria bacterium]|nr:oligosaccharide flippase family protein [Gammaproteobacteria bacterium]